MRSLRRWSFVFLSAAALASGVAVGQPPASGEKWFLDRTVSLSPMDAPVPALQYRLFPLEWDRKDGNAVPIFLRLIHEQRDETRNFWSETPKPWNEGSIDKIPMAEARSFLDRMANFYRQLDLGARRKSADWNYTFDQGTAVGLLIPDVTTMRSYVPMLVLRARVKAADGDFAGAVHALETGFAFSRHVAAAPILINGLVAISGANQFADAALDVIDRSGSPNLYWALTVLPRPLIDLRTAWDFEQRFFEMEFPEMLDLNRSRTPAQWDDLLKRLRTKMKELEATMADDSNKPAPPIGGTAPDDPASKSPDLGRARDYLSKRPGLDVAAMSPAQVLLLYISGTLHDLRDQQFTAVYLPYPQALQQLRRNAEAMKSAPATEATRITRIWLPAIEKVLTAQGRLDRKIAALRVIEAMRIYAARHGGQLPDSLAQIQYVPVPLDPGTGEPFEYRKTGATATLTSRVPGEQLDKSGLRFTISIRQ